MTAFASTFLSHSSADKALVNAVAAELGRRGVLAWLDVKELYPGQDLRHALDQAIEMQTTFALFLSDASVRSAWVQDELAVAINRLEQENKGKLIAPVFIGDPVDLVRSSPQLRGRWLHPDGSRVTQNGIRIEPNADMAENAAIIASQIASSAFQSVDLKQARELVIHLDQRGSTRCGEPQGLPESHKSISGAGLVIRPNPGEGKQKETIVGSDWDSVAAVIVNALSSALGGVRWPDPKKIYLSGHAQLGLAYLLGHHFNRSSDADLYCTDTRGVTFNNAGWDRTDAINGGNADCLSNTDAKLKPLPSGPFQNLALVVGRQNVLEGALPYLKANMPDTPVAWVRTPQLLHNSGDVKQVIADVTALLQRLKRENGCTIAYLVLGLPFAAIPLLAAHMSHVLPRFVLLEYRGDAAAAGVAADELYAPLSFPG